MQPPAQGAAYRPGPDKVHALRLSALALCRTHLSHSVKHGTRLKDTRNTLPTNTCLSNSSPQNQSLMYKNDIVHQVAESQPLFQTWYAHSGLPRLA